MRLASLGSGSAGNALVVEGGQTRLLVDAGFSGRQIEIRLRLLGIEPESLSGALITHEHQDHSRGCGVLARRWGLPLFMTAGTADACSALFSGTERIVPIEGERAFVLDDLEVEPLQTVHDAAEPVAFCVHEPATGLRIGVATDLGRPTTSVRRALGRCHFLVLEANHDELRLRESPYPWSVKQRIGGSRGHLSNRMAGDLAAELVHPDLGGVLLAHLSGECNSREEARREVGRRLARAGFRGLLQIAEQHEPTALYDIGTLAVRARPTRQLSLFRL
ncbi:MAG: MBL fold metallo-hydrolase [Gemmatimonadota bacterium]